MALDSVDKFCSQCGALSKNHAQALASPAQAGDTAKRRRREKPTLELSIFAAVLLVIVLAFVFHQEAPPPAPIVEGPKYNEAPPSTGGSKTEATDAKDTKDVFTDLTPSVAQAAIQSGGRSDMPGDERAFVAAAQQAQAAYNAAPNEMAKGGTRAARRAAICRAFSNGLVVSGWIGQIKELESNSDGNGVLTVSIADFIEVRTYNNALSDVGSHTMINPSSALFQKVSQLRVSANVIFAGTFFPSDVDCAEETSLSLGGSMTEPEFLFRFSTVEAY